MRGASEQRVLTILRDLAARLASRPEVAAVALAGSRTTQVADHDSDFDLYVYAESSIPLLVRTALADEFGRPGPREIGNDFWGSSDAWRVGTTGKDTDLDLMYFAPDWMADQLDRVLVRHQPSLGYSTCFWHTVRHSIALYDRDGWFARLQTQAAAPYPEPLRRAIIAHNYPVLRGIASSLRHQLARAIERADRVSIQHRLTAILASYFDILFAVNRQPHPGEKRLVAHALARCPSLPAAFPADLDALLAEPPGPTTITRTDTLLDGLDNMLMREGLR